MIMSATRHGMDWPIGTAQYRFIEGLQAGGQNLRKNVTISLDEDIYYALRQLVGRGSISRFIEKLVRRYVVQQDLEAAYMTMSQDEQREAEALEWAEGTTGMTR